MPVRPFLNQPPSMRICSEYTPNAGNHEYSASRSSQGCPSQIWGSQLESPRACRQTLARLGRKSYHSGLLIDPGVLQREDDFDGHEVNPCSLVATSRTVIMSGPPNQLASTTPVGSLTWYSTRNTYLAKQDQILRLQHAHAARLLRALLSESRPLMSTLARSGSEAICNVLRKVGSISLSSANFFC